MAKMSLSTATATPEKKSDKVKIEDKPMTPDDRARLLQLAKDGMSVKLISTKTGYDPAWVACTIDACLDDIALKIKLTEGYFDDKTRRKPGK
jgi:predicted secreted protein